MADDPTMKDLDSIDEKIVKAYLRTLPVEEAPEGLLARISTVVPHLPQQRPAVSGGFSARIARFLGEFQYGLSLKIAMLCVVAVMGVMTGHAGNGAGGGMGLIFGNIGVEDLI